MHSNGLSPWRPWLFAAALLNVILFVPLDRPELLGAASVLAVLCLACGPLVTVTLSNYVYVPPMPTAIDVHHRHEHVDIDDDADAWKRGE